MTQPGESFSCSVSPVWVLPHAPQLLSCQHCERFSHNGGTAFKSRSCHAGRLCESGRPEGDILSESSVAAGHPLTSLSCLRRDVLPALQLPPQSYYMCTAAEERGQRGNCHQAFHFCPSEYTNSPFIFCVYGCFSPKPPCFSGSVQRTSWSKIHMQCDIKCDSFPQPNKKTS